MTYDNWKSTEPDYGDERPQEGEEEGDMILKCYRMFIAVSSLESKPEI